MVNIQQMTFPNNISWSTVLLCIAISNSKSFVCRRSNWQHEKIASVNDLSPNRCQAITWANENIVYWHTHTCESLGLMVLTCFTVADAPNGTIKPTGHRTFTATACSFHYCVGYFAGSCWLFWWRHLAMEYHLNNILAPFSNQNFLDYYVYIIWSNRILYPEPYSNCLHLFWKNEAIHIAVMLSHISFIVT